MAEILAAEGDLTSLNVFDLLSGSMHFSLSKTPVTLTSPPVNNQPLLAFSFSQLNLAIGTTTFGLAITSGSIHAAALSDGAGASWFGLHGTGLSGSLNVPGVTATVAGLEVKVNQFSGTATAAIDWTRTEVRRVGKELSSQILAAEGDLTSLNVFDLLSGSMHFSLSKAPVTLSSPSVTGQPLLAFSFSQLNLAIGTTTFGLAITGGSIKAAALSDGAGASWFGLHGTGLSGSLNVPGVTATVAGLEVKVNQFSGTATAAIDWTQTALTSTNVGLVSQILAAEGDLTSLNVFDLLSGSMHFSLSKAPVTLSSPSVTGQPLLAFSFSQLNLAIGTTTFGLSITSGSIDAAALSDGAGASWFGLHGTGLSGSLNVPGVTATVAGLEVKVNQFSGTASAAIDWTQTALTSTNVGLASQILAAEGDLTSLNVFDLLSGSMHFSLSKSPVTLTSPPVNNQPLLAFSFSQLNLAIGTTTFGLAITGGSINAAALSDGAGASWFGLHGTGLSGSLNIPGVTATVAGLEVKVNQFSGSATAAIDWTQTALSSTNVGLMGEILAAEGDLTSLNVFDLLSGSMHFSLSKAPVTLSSPSVTGQPLLAFSFSQLNLAIGTTTFGLAITGGSIKAAALSDGAGASWFGLHGTGLSGSLNVPGVTATVAALEVKVNKFSGNATAAIDWTQTALTSTNVGLATAILAAEGDLTSLNVFDLLSGSMHFSLSKSPVTLTSPPVNNQPLLALSFSQLNLAIGTTTFGLSITSGSIHAAALSDGAGASWFGLHGTGLSGSLNIPGVTATVAGLEVKVNKFSGTATAAIDWTQAALSSTNVGLMAEILAAEGDLTSLNVFDLLSGSMHFSLSKTPVTLTSPPVNNQPLLSLCFSQLNLAIGTTTFGLAITGGSINAAALSDGAGASWFGLHGTGLSGSLNIPGVSATVAGLEVKVNRFSGSATAAIDWTQTALTSTGVDLMNAILAAEGDLTSLNVFDLLSGSMHFSLSKSPVTLTSPPVNNQPLLAFSFSQLNLAVGTPTFGLSITSGSIHAAALSDGAGASWFGLHGTGLSGSLNVPGVTATVAGLEVKVNQFSGTASAAIDWTQAALTSTNVGLASQILAAEGDLTSLNVFDLLSGSMHFSLSKTPVTLTSPPVNSQPLLAFSFSQLNLAIGTPTFGLAITSGTIKIGALSDGTNNWFGLDASQLAGTFTVGSGFISATLANGVIKLNRASNGTLLDWTQGGLSAAHLNLTSNQPTVISGQLVSLQIANILRGSTGFSLVRTTGVNAPSVSVTNGTLMVLTFTNLFVSVGSTSIGVVITGTGITLAILSNSSNTATWVGINATGLGANLTVPGVVADVSNLTVQVNKAQVAPNQLIWADVADAPAAIKALPTGDSVKVEGDLANLSVASLITGSAHFTVATEIVDVTGGPTLANATLLTLSLSKLLLKVGVGSFGLTIGDGTDTSARIGIASIAPADAADTRRWLAVVSSNLSISLSLPVVSASISGVSIQANRASGTSTLLNWGTQVMQNSLPFQVFAGGVQVTLDDRKSTRLNS